MYEVLDAFPFSIFPRPFVRLHGEVNRCDEADDGDEYGKRKIRTVWYSPYERQPKSAPVPFIADGIRKGSIHVSKSIVVARHKKANHKQCQS